MSLNVGRVTYYDHSRFSNTFYLAQIALETYLSKILFEGDLSRVLYASREFCFRQRIQQLEKHQIVEDSYIGLPFLSYYRNGNWAADTQYAAPAGLGLGAISDPDIGNLNVKTIPVQTSFDCTVFYGRDDDAQVAYNQLVSSYIPQIQQQFHFPSITYKNYEIDLPISLQVSNLNFQPQYRENEWLKMHRMIPISFTLTVRTVMFNQKAYVVGSGTPDPEETVYLTERVLLDFLSFKFDDRIDETFIDLEVIGTLDPEETLNPIITQASIENTAATITWDYTEASLPYFEENVKIVINNYETVEVPITDKAYTFSDLSEGSLYNITLWFVALDGKVTKATTSFTTTTDGDPELKGMIGYTF